MSELQIPVKQQDDGVHGHGYNQGIDDCMPLIKQLQTKLAESEARVGRLEKACRWALDAKPYRYKQVFDAEFILNESPAQSLQHIEAAAVEKFILNAIKAGELVNDHSVIEKLRQQQTNGGVMYE